MNLSQIIVKTISRNITLIICIHQIIIIIHCLIKSRLIIYHALSKTWACLIWILVIGTWVSRTGFSLWKNWFVWADRCYWVGWSWGLSWNSGVSRRSWAAGNGWRGSVRWTGWVTWDRNWFSEVRGTPRRGSAPGKELDLFITE